MKINMGGVQDQLGVHYVVEATKGQLTRDTKDRKINMEPVWETLDEEVHRSVVLVRSMEDKINKAVEEWGPDALRVSASKGGVAELYALYRAERTHLARTAKQSMDAGTAKLRAVQARTNAESIVRVLTYALDSAGLSDDLRAVCVDALSEALSLEGRGALDSGRGRVIEGVGLSVQETPQIDGNVVITGIEDEDVHEEG